MKRGEDEKAEAGALRWQRLQQESHEMWRELLAREPEEGNIKLRQARAAHALVTMRRDDPTYDAWKQYERDAQADWFALCDRKRAERSAAKLPREPVVER